MLRKQLKRDWQMKYGKRKKESLITESWFEKIREVDDGEMASLRQIAQQQQEVVKLAEEISSLQVQISKLQEEIVSKRKEMENLEREMAEDEYAMVQNQSRD